MIADTVLRLVGLAKRVSALGEMELCASRRDVLITTFGNGKKKEYDETLES